MQELIRKIHSLYDGYLSESEKLERERKPFSGAFGLGPKPQDDPIHERFPEQLRALLEAVAAAGPESAELRELLRWLYEAPLKHPEPRTAYWNLLAVQGLTLELIDLLRPEDAVELAAWYARAWPRWTRLPVQQQLLKALKQHG